MQRATSLAQSLCASKVAPLNFLFCNRFPGALKPQRRFKIDVKKITDLKYLKRLRQQTQDPRDQWDMDQRIIYLESRFEKNDRHKRVHRKYNFLIECAVPDPHQPQALNLATLYSFYSNASITPERAIENAEFLKQEVEPSSTMNGIRVQGPALEPVVAERLADFVASMCPHLRWLTVQPSEWNSNALNQLKLLNASIQSLAILNIRIPPNTPEEKLASLADTIPHLPEVNGLVTFRGCDMKTFEAVVCEPAVTFRAHKIKVIDDDSSKSHEVPSAAVVETLKTILRGKCDVKQYKNVTEFKGL